VWDNENAVDSGGRLSTDCPNLKPSGFVCYFYDPDQIVLEMIQPPAS
jgi:hypothetical protein